MGAQARPGQGRASRPCAVSVHHVRCATWCAQNCSTAPVPPPPPNKTTGSPCHFAVTPPPPTNKTTCRAALPRSTPAGTCTCICSPRPWPVAAPPHALVPPPSCSMLVPLLLVRCTTIPALPPPTHLKAVVLPKSSNCSRQWGCHSCGVYLGGPSRRAKREGTSDKGKGERRAAGGFGGSGAWRHPPRPALLLALLPAPLPGTHGTRPRLLVEQPPHTPQHPSIFVSAVKCPDTHLHPPTLVSAIMHSSTN